MKYNSKKALLVTGERKLKNTSEKLFSELKVSPFYLNQLSEVLPFLSRENVDIIIFGSDTYQTQKETFSELLQTVSLNYPQSESIILARENDVPFVVSVLKFGSTHYIKYPVGIKELQSLMKSAMATQPAISPRLEKEPGKDSSRFGLIMGKSTKMQQVYAQMRHAAMTDIPVLLIGETGTGKDLAAQTIHQQSERSAQEYLPVNLGSLPNELVASELFGHEKGSFTGATHQHIGVFERATEGTVFLDEIDSVDEKVQISLLRLLEQKKFNRLGGKKTIKTDARIIAASNENLEELLRKGQFRQDLYYRLDVFRITMPPLREKIEDIPMLIEDFLTRFNKLFNKKVKKLDPECLEVLQAYNWPGNVRELKNIIQRAVLLAEGDRLYIHNLPPRLQKTRRSAHSISFRIGTPLDQIEKEVIKETLALTHNNRTQAAKLLGITRRALYNKLNKHKLK
ncbi:MAG: sigma-54-dependent Fis family transcriptional regulator [Calditrichaeota bacterium]|nr:sigma-54-dependent Fis family transcriptional regulator [Calditrichota bacterium]